MFEYYSDEMNGEKIKEICARACVYQKKAVLLQPQKFLDI